MSVNPRAVEIAVPSGATLRGQLWGEGADWIVLLHDEGEDRDLDDWRPLLPAIMSHERTLLTLDLPGHGASDDTSDAVIDDVLAYVRSRSSKWVAVAAAGVTATAVLEAAGRIPIDALVLISPDIEPGGTRELRGMGEPKLFAVGGGSEPRKTAVREARNRSIGWAMLVSLPTEVQGTDLLNSPYRSQLSERIVAFLAEQRALARMLEAQLPKRRDGSSEND